MLQNDETQIVDGMVYFTNEAEAKYKEAVLKHMNEELRKPYTSGRGGLYEEHLVEEAALTLGLRTSDGVYPQDLWEWAFELVEYTVTDA